ncbi:L-aspartate oxidase [Kibdelosporangium phytohabitans]|uniref:L-aspartate oxidase n=1 Tax=Kibdelosporangium phytohabitans TaxID=860235 RepID=A0A0N9HWX9_9PSEU|nr:L-aspartate oxidase [Kibdelosporangium phytohabitans]ALG06390.1 hypothetical protein AOZ06_05125 [Kibdelosporangium phytohabitans]MBE1467537.1 L-aspartate oxidase [Kibdelosporangium phytohabitans]
MITPVIPHWTAGADLIIVGSGAAGLTTAITARDLGLRVIVLTKAEAGHGSTRAAMGGIAAVLPEADPADDSLASHIADTLAAGAGLSDPDVAEAILRAAPAAIRDLTRLGMPWDRDATGTLARGTEGGHSTARIAHVQDTTGRALSDVLLRQARTAVAHSDNQILILEHHTAVDLLRSSDNAVVGVLVLDQDGRRGLVFGAVVLATGGIGGVYEQTTNPDGALGDGLALALRAGAKLADLEFVQFHPTAMFLGPGITGQLPLVTEALRGHGSVRLCDNTGAPLMQGVHPQEDLAPRDVIAAVITRRMRETGTDHVFLDARHVGLDGFQSRFPTVLADCYAIGIDPVRQLIPVAPARHYLCGGVMSTIDGRTGVRGLYVVGEAARTGLHGANRLASNGLLEALVMGTLAACAVRTDRCSGRLGQLAGLRILLAPTARVAPLATIRAVMSRYVGVDRTADGLATARRTLADVTTSGPLDSVEAANASAALLVARAVITAADTRQESRGCHQRRDFPHRAHQRHGLDVVTVSLDPTTGSTALAAWWSERTTA